MQQNQYSNTPGLQLPPYLSTGDPASFAMYTILVRKPNIINDVIVRNKLADVGGHERVIDNLHAFEQEIKNGVIIDPFTNQSPPGRGKGWAPHISPEKFDFPAEAIRSWRKEIACCAGQPWIGLPWYFAEAYFYLRLLMAIEYYTPNARLYHYDLFQPMKQHELQAEGGGLFLARSMLEYLETLPNQQEILHALLFFSLWGNRIDLSNDQVAQHLKEQILSHDHDALVVDHVDALLATLGQAKRVDIILDNAGSELACDLLLAWHLLNSDPDKTCYFHAKSDPFFVSDTTEQDIPYTIDAFCQDADPRLSQAGQDLQHFLNQGRFMIRTHHFWNGPLHFEDFPADLREELVQSDLTLVKGDVNYRRVLGDRKWPCSTSMETITGYFPCTFAVLRTMKGEIVVDLDEKRYAELFWQDRQWMLNGERGIIRLVIR